MKKFLYGVLVVVQSLVLAALIIWILDLPIRPAY